MQLEAMKGIFKRLGTFYHRPTRKPTTFRWWEHSHHVKDKYSKITPVVHTESSYYLQIAIIVEKEVVPDFDEKEEYLELLAKHPDRKILLPEGVIDLFKLSNVVTVEVFKDTFYRDYCEHQLGDEAGESLRAICFEEVSGEHLAHILQKLIRTIFFDRKPMIKEVRQTFPNTIQNQKGWNLVHKIVPGYVYRSCSKRMGDVFLLSRECLPIDAIDEHGIRQRIGISNIRVSKGELVRGDDSLFEEMISTWATSDCINDRNLAKRMVQLRTEAKKQTADRIAELKKEIAKIERITKPNYKS